MPVPRTATVRICGRLSALRENRGLASTVEVGIPPCGFAASALARGLNLPLENIGTVIINNHKYCLDHCVYPGDRVAFVSKEITGTAPKRMSEECFSSTGGGNKIAVDCQSLSPLGHGELSGFEE
jgi:hypothetical protein